MSKKISSDRAARFLERALGAGRLDTETTAEAQQLLEQIDAGSVRGLAVQLQRVIDAGFRRGALAVAAAETARETRVAVAQINAISALADALGIGSDSVTETVTESAPETVTETRNWGAA